MLITELGANLISAVSRPPGLGKVFYVNGQTGADANNGVDPGTPFQTIAFALTQCVGFRNDYIIVLRGGGQAYPITVAADKQRVHIIGITNDSPQRVLGFAAGAAAVFDIAADQVEIAGFQLLADVNNPGINISGMAWGLWVHHCTFGTTVAVQDGIRCSVGEGLVGGCVEKNYFGHMIARDGIRLQPTGSTFRNNIFREVGGVGINLSGEVGAIIGNYFYSPIALALAAGWAITQAGYGAIISGNRASQAGDNAGTNPYRDLSTGVLATCLNGWSDNFDGQALSAGPDVV